MSCAEIVPKLELMADDELSSEQAAEVLSHIDDCAGCRDNWYGILNLRKAIKERASTFSPSAAFEDKMINAVRKEAWQSTKSRPKKVYYFYAAAFILAGLVAVVIFRGLAPSVTIADKTSAGQKSDASAGLTADTSDAKTESTAFSAKSAPSASIPGTNLQIATSAPTSLDDAVDNFKKFLKGPRDKHFGSNEVKEGDLAALSQQAGFSIRPIQLSGFKLAGAQLVNASPGKAPVVRLCYVRKKGIGRDAILCYQAAAGNLVASGLNEHMIDGKKICCGEVGDKSIVYIPGQKTNANEVLLLGTISKSDLMDLVLSNS